MKKVIRLTENDLMKIVKRVIKESSETDQWTKQDQKELNDLRNQVEEVIQKWKDKYGNLSSDEKLKNMDSNNPLFRKYENLTNQINVYSDKKRKYDNFLENERYSNVAKNRPSDFDVDKYNDEYWSHSDEIESLSPSVPKYSDYGAEREDEWYKDFTSSPSMSKINKLSQKRDFYSKHLDRDLKRKR